MSRYANLRSDEKIRIEAKLSELNDRTGQQWAYQVLERRGGEEKISPLLEITINGRMLRPLDLPLAEKCPVAVICAKLESQAQLL